MMAAILLGVSAVSVMAQTADKGFVHPGALHTQSDFDRIKQQLANGNEEVTKAYEYLLSSKYSKSNVKTYPVDKIVRGGTKQNYMNAARGAAMAYQNALVWKICGDTAHADRAVSILNQWARRCKAVGGDTNQSLASGLYGYAFANAAELVRDYDGWSRDDFEAFKRWIYEVWYPRCIDFLRRRHDTWKKGRPGHYWSNWGLCNTLALMSFGVLLDDVFIYNQGVSFYKHDQVGTFTGEYGSYVENTGLNEFLGNLVPAISDDERGPYGQLGQMQESGRDQGHALMALGLAVDICQIGWNQGDDLFSIMDNRLAAGIEYVAAYNAGESELPWTTYRYRDVRNSDWRQSGNNGGSRGQFRPYWDRIIGHYEGVKGVSMGYSRQMKEKQPVDRGGGSYGETSGGFDHLGFTTLTCTRPKAEPSMAPTAIVASMELDGKTLEQSEAGGLVNTYNSSHAASLLPRGTKIKLMPRLSYGVSDTGNWRWSTGETTRDIEITANESRIYRVYYTNANGVESTQMFSIAVEGDCTPEKLTPTITVDGETISGATATVKPMSEVTLKVGRNTSWGEYSWSSGEKSMTLKLGKIDISRDVSFSYKNQGGRESTLDFSIKVDNPAGIADASAHGGADLCVDTKTRTARVTLGGRQRASFSIYNADGKLMKAVRCKACITVIDLGSLPKGVYIAVVKGTSVEKKTKFAL